MTAVRDLGANFYLNDSHVGKVSRADAAIGQLRELNDYVKVSTIASRAELDAALASGSVHVVCQTEMLLNGEVLDPAVINATSRQNNIGYISTQTFGPWGYAFLDYGADHIVTDHDGEQTKSYIIVNIEKGEKTKLTLHEDKRHIYQMGDHVVLREIEGMTEINNLEPIKILDTTVYTITLDIDSTKWGDYIR